MFRPASVLAVTVFAVLSGDFACPVSAQAPAPVPGGRQVLSYRSEITVHRNTNMAVHETITVSVPGAPLHNEIYRDILTNYDDRFGNAYAIHFEVTSLEHDGQPEAYSLRKIENGLRVYMGKGGAELQAGTHTYDLAYTVDREIGMFPDHDELYWNVTGNGWRLPIEKAGVTVHLVGGIAREAILLDAYTGAPGAVGIDYKASVDRQSNATVETTRPLGPHEGLTLVVRWPKGFVRPPTEEEKHQYFMEDHQAQLIGLLGLLVALIYYAAAWFLAGLDPTRGEIHPESEPPRGLSPAAIRYAWRRAFDQKTMVADLVDLAVKKRLAILEDLAGAFILGVLPSTPTPAGAGRGCGERRPPKIIADQKLVLHRLFAAGDTIRLQPAHHAMVGGALEALHHHLRSRSERSYLWANRRYLIPGLLISLATVARCGFSIQGGQGLLVFFLTLGLLPLSLACLTLVFLAAASWRNALSDPYFAPVARKLAVRTSVICLPLLLGEVAGLLILAWAASTELVMILMFLIAINYVFHILLKAPNRCGRALMNQIEGFRMSLTSTEQDPQEAAAILPTTPEVFEKFLPYAIAFNVEKVWGEKSAAALAQAGPKRTSAYPPHWYTGPGWNPLTASTFASWLGISFSSALSSSMLPPGSKARHRRTPPSD